MKRSAVFCWLLLWTAAATLSAQDVVFNRISTGEGLSHYSALSMYEDEFGTVWTATPMGLSRCGSTRVSTYIHDVTDDSSLSCNNVKKVSGNRDGQVYVLTKNSFEVFDLHKERFSIQHEFTPAFHVDCFFYRDGLYAIINGSSIVRWSGNCSSYTVLHHLPEGKHYYYLFVDKDGGLWASSSDSLYYIDKDLKFGFEVLDDVSIHSMYMDKAGRMLLCTRNKGLLVIAPDFMVKRRLGVREGLASDMVRTVCQDEGGNYWVGTDKGLNRLDSNLEVRDLYVKNEKEGSLSNSSIYDVLQDVQGNIWIGTYFGGINVFNPRSQVYRKLLPSSEPDEGLGSGFVSCMTEDKDHNLWIGTVDGGLTFYDRKNNTYRQFRHSGKRNSLSGDNVKALYYDGERNELWIGTHLKGLDCLDLETMRFHHVPLPGQNEFMMSNVVSGIVRYGDQLVISSYNGVFLYHLADGTFENLLQLTYIRTLFMDSSHKLWLGTTSGQLFSYDMQSRELFSYGGNMADEDGHRYPVYDMAEDKSGNVWMATFGGGIKRFVRKTGKMESFTTGNSGLSSNNMLAISCLGENKLIATDHDGYVIYDLEKSQFFTHNRQVGLPVDFIMENSLFVSETGIVYIGTNDGLLYFNSEDIRFLSKSYPLTFSHLWVNGEEVRPGDGTGILDESIRYASEIKLKSSQNSFAVSFDIPEYNSNMDFNLVYRFGEEDEPWQRLLPGERFVKFYNLSPGRYELVIRTPEGDLNQVGEQKIKIVVSPPFYSSVYAWFIYLVVLMVILYVVVYIYTNRLRMKERLRYEKKKAYNARKLSQAKMQSKLQFFFGVSHEFSTPLTIITGELEILLMKYQFSPEIKEKLNNVYRNSLVLHDLIFELLEFRKHEMNRIQLRVSEQDLGLVAEESFHLYKEYSISRGIDFSLVCPEEKVMVWCDRKQIYKVINNLLSNAFKYTEAAGRVELVVSQTEDEVQLSVRDSGCGMEKEDLDQIFSDFYQGKHSADKAGVGIGLALVKKIIEAHKGQIEVQSKLNEGTAFKIRLKKGKAHFSTAEIADGQVSEKDRQLAVPEIQEVSEDQKTDYTVLVVEDNASLREMLAGIFSQYYHVLTAQDGVQGWECVSSEPVDLVVSDIIMPNMTGTELCRKIKDSIETCHIPVILLSVQAEVQNLIEGFDARADDYMGKPFSVKLLLSRCRSLLQNRRMLQDRFRQSPVCDFEVLTSNDLDRSFTEKLVGIIEDNIDNQDLNINFLMKEMYVSRTTLFNKLKAITGQTPMEFILNVRLKRAAQLLKNRHDMSVSAVSDATGFCSAKYFSRIFKQTYHICPSDYRNGKETIG